MGSICVLPIQVGVSIIYGYTFIMIMIKVPGKGRACIPEGLQIQYCYLPIPVVNMLNSSEQRRGVDHPNFCVYIAFVMIM